jgi:hypothetical protein
VYRFLFAIAATFAPTLALSDPIRVIDSVTASCEQYSDKEVDYDYVCSGVAVLVIPKISSILGCNWSVDFHYKLRNGASVWDNSVERSTSEARCFEIPDNGMINSRNIFISKPPIYRGNSLASVIWMTTEVLNETQICIELLGPSGIAPAYFCRLIPFNISK